MRHGDYVSIPEIGDFGMLPKEKRRRIVADEEKAKFEAFQRYAINAKWNRRKKWKKRWQVVMEIRKQQGLEPWTFKDWMKIIGRKY
jgi:hypothetical protein